MNQAAILLLSVSNFLPELVQVPLEDLQALLALLLLRPGLLGVFLKEQSFLLHFEHQVSMTLQLLLLLGLNRFQEHDLFLVDG